MAEGFLSRYNEELAALRQRAGRFANAFPKIAGRLRMSDEVADDPHVERLIQSFAYSAARIRQKLDDEFPELTDSMLETLYPHYLAPIPSMTIVQFEPGRTLASQQVIPRHSELVAEPIGGESCRFRTTQDVRIAPVELVGAKLTGQPVEAPPAPFPGVAGCLRLSLRSTDERLPLSAVGLTHLRLCLTAPWQQAVGMHELLVNHVAGLAFARHADDRTAIFMPSSKLTPVGFQSDEAMLPYPAASFAGYRLLSEFFALPQKFLFLEIAGLEAWQGDAMEVFIYLRKSDPKLERSLTARDIALHASPAVNLFRQGCEPVAIDGTRTEYRLIADARRQKTREIHSVERVVLTDVAGRRQTCQPFFGRSQRTNGASIYFQIYRRFDEDDGTSDTDIAFVDPNKRHATPLDTVASIDALCLNRDLPEQLPFGGGHPHLQLASGHEAVASVMALTPPTPAVRMNDREGRAWRLVSHLVLNHLSIADGQGGALKDILSLYAFRDTPETRQLVDAIAAVETHQSLARMAHGGMVSGTEVNVSFDPAVIDQPTAHLFGLVLDRFFGLYTSMNSFTRLTVTMKGMSEPVARFPARAAERPLI